MKQILDTVTAALGRALDILFVQNPRGTSLGIFVGISAYGGFQMITPIAERIREWIDPARVNVYYFIAAGIAAFNLPSLFRRRRLSDDIEDAYEAVHRLKRQGVSKVQIKMQYLAIANVVVQRVTANRPGTLKVVSPKQP